MELAFLLLALIPEALGNICKGLQSAVIAHPESCKKFVICEEERPSVLTCPGDLYFDVIIRSCILHSLAHCAPKRSLTTTPVPLPYQSTTPSPTTTPSSTSYETLPPITTASTSTGTWQSLPPIPTTESSTTTDVEPSALPPIPTSEPSPKSNSSESTTPNRVDTTTSISTSRSVVTTSEDTSTITLSTSSSTANDLLTTKETPLDTSSASVTYITTPAMSSSEQTRSSNPETTESLTTIPGEKTKPVNTSPTSSSISTISNVTSFTTPLSKTTVTLSSETFDDMTSPTTLWTDSITSTKTLSPVPISSTSSTTLETEPSTLTQRISTTQASITLTSVEEASTPPILSESTTEGSETDVSETTSPVEPSSLSPITNATQQPPTAPTLPPISTNQQQMVLRLMFPKRLHRSNRAHYPDYKRNAKTANSPHVAANFKYYTLVNPENTSSFYYCVLGTRYLFKCPYNYEFDPYIHVCVSP
ncbi:unnamed protein product, partial [Iphiclides podalirius]